MIRKYLLGVKALAVAAVFVACSNGSSENSVANATEPFFADSSPSKSGANLKDSRDGQTYKTVTIGSQIWMAENLNYETANSSCFNSDPRNCEIYGRLYSWAAAVGKKEENCGYGATCELTGPVKGVCPSGWHLPTKTEFEILLSAVGDWYMAAPELKYTDGWNHNGNGTNTYGFAALPAGYRYVNGHFLDLGNMAMFWTSVEESSYWAYCMSVHFSDSHVTLASESKSDGFSVRCVKD